MVTVRGIDSIYIFAGGISLLLLLPFWWPILRSRGLVTPLGKEEAKMY